jgi:prepilin-type N-terminal cleavage/methylation domain-containing protein
MPKYVSNYGQKRGMTGFTLLEVLIAVTILSVSLAQIFAIMLNSVVVIKHLDNRINARFLLAEESWNFRNPTNTKKDQISLPYEKNIGADPVYNISVSEMGNENYSGLKGISIRISWREGIRTVSLYRFLCEKLGE